MKKDTISKASSGASAGGLPSRPNHSFSSNSLAEITTANSLVKDSSVLANDCLETSLQILQTSVEHAKEHAGMCYEKTQKEWCVGSPEFKTNNSGDESFNRAANGDNTQVSPSSYEWWMSLFHRLQETHAADRKQWQNDLRKAQSQGEKFKHELQTHMADRLQWLEEQIENQPQSGSGSGPGASNNDNGEAGSENTKSHSKQHRSRHGLESDNSRSSRSQDTVDGGYEVDDERSNRKNNYTIARISSRSNEEDYQSRDEAADESSVATGIRSTASSLKEPANNSARTGRTSMHTQAGSTMAGSIRFGVNSDLTEPSAFIGQFPQQHYDGTNYPSPTRLPLGLSASHFTSFKQTQTQPMSPQQQAGEGESGAYDLRFESDFVMQRIGELERAVKFHEQEKTMAFEQANRVKEQGEQLTELSETMQEQLIQLMREVETASWKQTKKWKEKVAVQKQLLDLLETQHATAVKEWKKEKELLENTIAQLTADKIQLKKDLKAEQSGNTAEDRKKWKREKEIYENTIAQLTADKFDLREQVNNLRASSRQLGWNDADEDGEAGRHEVVLLGERPPSPKSCLKKTPSRPRHSSPSMTSPRRVEWEDKLDRAIIERDMYKHEAEETSKKLAEAEKLAEQAKKSLADALKDSDSQAAQDLLKQKETEWKEAMEKARDEHSKVVAEMKRQMDAKNDLDCNKPSPLRKAVSEDYALNHERQLREDAQHLLRTKETQWKKDTEQKLKELRDEYTEVIEDLERRLDDERNHDTKYRESCDKRNELIARLRTMEKKHDEEKGEWKLRLESALAKTRAETKERMEKAFQKVREEHTKQIDDLRTQLLKAQEKYKNASSEVTSLHNTGSETQSYCELENKELMEQRKQLEAELKEHKELFLRQTEQWTKMLDLSKSDNEERIQKLQAKHLEETEDLTNQLKASKDEMLGLVNKSDELLDKLNNLEKAREHDSEMISKLETQVNTSIKEKQFLVDKTNELNSTVESLRSQKERQTKEIDDLKTQLKSSFSERHQQIDKSTRLSQDIEALKSEKDKYLDEIENLKEQLEASKDETRGLIDKTNDLVHSLENLKNTHNRAKDKWESQLQSVISEKDKQIFQLELKVSKADQDRRLLSENKPALKELKQNICNAIEELQKDVVAVRETLDSSSKADTTIANANHIELSENVNLMQSSLNEAIAELTLGTEAMIEVKAVIEALSKGHQPQQGATCDTPSASNPQHEMILNEIAELRKQLSSIVEKNEEGMAENTIVLKDSMRQQLLNEIQKKETEIAAMQGELLQIKKELESEKGKLHHAESEIMALNDQADAYSEELMRMQALNAGMEETLKATERKMEAALRQSAKKSDDDSPFLDEALALAKGLTDLVHGDQDADVMDMLRSLSDLMDQQDQDRVHLPATLSEDFEDYRDDGSSTMSPIFSRNSKEPRGDSVSERPPAPVETPDKFAGCDNERLASPTRSSRSLQMIVEQLYGRCQLLERERTQMMEVTLDLLTSARQANAAEIDAALATARRKSMEEVTRVYQQSQLDKERLYHRLCGSCVKSLSSISEGSAVAKAKKSGGS